MTKVAIMMPSMSLMGKVSLMTKVTDEQIVFPIVEAKEGKREKDASDIDLQCRCPKEEISRDPLSPVLSQIGAQRQRFDPVHPIGQHPSNPLCLVKPGSLIADSLTEQSVH